ncbi:hypothetical protein KC351_g69 [Hortaea werneckii]|nr:hypothetical protein KC351_g69 [Hortaea werneckii]
MSAPARDRRIGFLQNSRMKIKGDQDGARTPLKKDNGNNFLIATQEGVGRGKGSSTLRIELACLRSLSSSRRDESTLATAPFDAIGASQQLIDLVVRQVTVTSNWRAKVDHVWSRHPVKAPRDGARWSRKPEARFTSAFRKVASRQARDGIRSAPAGELKGPPLAARLARPRDGSR